METFAPIFSQMIFLFAFIIIGFILVKWKFIPENSSQVLSRLETLLFIPALMMGVFLQNCTVERIETMWKLLLSGFIVVAILIPLSFFVAKLCFKEAYLQKITTYGLAFSNFAYMGNAIVAAVFPAMYADYLVFCLPLWLLINAWGVPVLLISNASGKRTTVKDSLKNLVNPMLIASVIGIVLGLTGWGKVLPAPITNVITVSGNCMSPIAMLFTGAMLGKLDILALLKKWRIYVVSAIKLLAYPLLFIGVFMLLPMGEFVTETFLKCALCVAAMPVGLNAIVVPAGYGKDASDAAAMALVSHILSIATIPLMFMLLQNLVL